MRVTSGKPGKSVCRVLGRRTSLISSDCRCAPTSPNLVSWFCKKLEREGARRKHGGALRTAKQETTKEKQKEVLTTHERLEFAIDPLRASACPPRASAFQ